MDHEDAADRIDVLAKAAGRGDLAAARRIVVLLESAGAAPESPGVTARRRVLADMAAEGDAAAAAALLAELAGGEHVLLAEVSVPRAPGSVPGAYVIKPVAKGDKGHTEYVVHYRNDETGRYVDGDYSSTYQAAVRVLARRLLGWADR